MPKLLDVPKYTKDGHYRIDVPFTSLDHTIARFEQEYGLQINPDFQRGHVWDQKKQTAFVEHMLKGGKGSEELRFNCVNWMRDPKPPMVLVDGLQRLTAVQLFMNNRLPVFGYTLHEYEDHKLPHEGFNTPCHSGSMIFRPGKTC